MAQNGHEIVFIVNETIQKSVEKFGFRVIALKESSKEENTFRNTDDPAKDFAAFLDKSGLFTNKSAIEKMAFMQDENDMVQGTLKTMFDFYPQIERALDEEQVDAYLYDHVIVPRALLEPRRISWMMLCSASPLLYYCSDLLPPGGSGYPTADKTQWATFDYEKNSKIFCTYQRQFDKHFGLEPDMDEFWRSPYLNIYQYPLELDYHNVNGFTIPETFVGIDAFVRKDPGSFRLPESFLSKQTGSDKLIYFSLGSMGSYDVEVMKRILTILSKLPYKFIVSKGPRGDEYGLPDNCWGENHLPQPEIVQMVDLAIIHGGNNSFTETFSAGRKMITFPFFLDQFDNAQRLHETGYGIKLDLYDFTEKQLVDAIEKLLNDVELEERLEKVRQRVIHSTRREDAARKVEEVVERHRSQ